MNITFFLTIISILITIITLIFFIAFLFKKIGRIPVIIFFIILFVCTFITLFYFGISSPSVMQGGLTTVGNTADLDIFYKYDGFFGSATDTQTWSSIFTSSEIPGNANVNMTWGPSYGWYLMLISAILSIVGLCVTIFKKE